MRSVIVTLLLFLPISGVAQTKSNDAPWNLGCENMETQLEMNVCAYKAFKIADSLLNNDYNLIINHLDKLYKEEVKNAGAQPDQSTKDFIDGILKQKQAVMNSMQSFAKHRDTMTRIIDLQYQGGSMRPFAVNNYALMITVDQLKVIKRMMEELIE
jgi:uncharacterized protein YecT (DUF1311 family)